MSGNVGTHRCGSVDGVVVGVAKGGAVVSKDHNARWILRGLKLPDARDLNLDQHFARSWLGYFNLTKLDDGILSRGLDPRSDLSIN